MSIELSLSANPDRFTSRNWLFTPLGTDPYRGIVSVSGIAIPNFAGSPGGWRRDRLVLGLDDDLNAASMQAPWGLPQPNTSWSMTFGNWLALATVNSRQTGQAPAYGGTALDGWGLNSGAPWGIWVDLAAYGGETIWRIAYRLDLHATLQPAENE